MNGQAFIINMNNNLQYSNITKSKSTWIIDDVSTTSNSSTRRILKMKLFFMPHVVGNMISSPPPTLTGWSTSFKSSVHSMWFLILYLFSLSKNMEKESWYLIGHKSRYPTNHPPTKDIRCPTFLNASYCKVKQLLGTVKHRLISFQKNKIT